MKKVSKELDVYSGIAIIFVVLIHANAYYLTSILNFKTYVESGLFLTTIDQIIHSAVPMFIFIAGFKYHFNSNKHINYGSFFKKKLIRVLVPFIVVSGFYLLVNNLEGLLTPGLNLSEVIANTFDEFIMIFYGYNYVYPLWYIPMYLVIILLYPLINRMIQSQKNRFLIFSFLSVLYVLFLKSNQSLGDYSILLSSTYYFIFFELGTFIAANKLDKSKQQLLSVVYLSILSISIFTAGSSFSTMLTDLLLFPLAVCVFYYLAVHLKESNFLRVTGLYSFHIFLFHEPVFTYYLGRYLKNNDLYNGYYITLLIVLTAITLCIALSKVLEVTGLSRFVFWGSIRKKILLKKSNKN